MRKRLKLVMASLVYYLRNQMPLIAFSALVFIWACVSGFGFLPVLLTSLNVILSALFYAIHNQRHADAKELCSDQLGSPGTEERGDAGEAPENGWAFKLSDSYSEGEVVDEFSTTSEESDADWVFAGEGGWSPDCSDGSISDEESLIEIALPSGHYVGSEEGKPTCESRQKLAGSVKEEESGFGLAQKLPDFSPESIFGQRGLMELLTELNDANEEDNLIEIDISMGSIKCSRFEIEARVP